MKLRSLVPLALAATLAGCGGGERWAGAEWSTIRVDGEPYAVGVLPSGERDVWDVSSYRAGFQLSSDPILEEERRLRAAKTALRDLCGGREPAIVHNVLREDTTFVRARCPTPAVGDLTATSP